MEHLVGSLLHSGSGSGKRTSLKGRHRAPARLYRLVFQLPWEPAVELLIEWMEWAWDCGVEACEGLGDKVAGHIDEILITLRCGLSNARVESMNTRLRLVTRRAFGFHSAEALIALALLSQGGVRPALPWQPRPLAA